ncbi:MAG: cytochrome c [Pseudomonadota bacterium]
MSHRTARLAAAAALGLAIAVGAGLAPTLWATTGSEARAADVNADAQIKYRKSVFRAVGGAANNIAAIMKGDVTAPEGQKAKYIAVLAAAADPALIETAFKPDTSGQGTEKTTVSGKIWSDFDGFMAKARDLEKAVAALSAKGEDAGFDDMKAVFGTCKACHDAYRER